MDKSTGKMDEEEGEAGQKAIDKEYGIDDLLEGKVTKEDVDSGKLLHEIKHLNVDLDCLTSGDIDWVAVMGSFKWMVEKTHEVLMQNKDQEEKVSQFLAKTCVMHVVQCFHHCRRDAAPGFAHDGKDKDTKPWEELQSQMEEHANVPGSGLAEGSSLNPPPSETG